MKHKGRFLHLHFDSPEIAKGVAGMINQIAYMYHLDGQPLSPEQALDAFLINLAQSFAEVAEKAAPKQSILLQ